eukprot:TRINITY_DN14483_c0_g1_i1.p1 TRINITY_DN14483_c0_g1~~TRINITY_DN14483_c0_g1_i1.p1  ORF type:complete len:562 (+),score=138.60 TRINITY_DN14483_c0_g1_i1:87-1772(+)
MPTSSSGGYAEISSRRGSGYSASIAPTIGSEGSSTVTAVKVGYKHTTGEDTVLKDVTLKVTNQHTVGKAIDKMLKALSGRYPQYSSKTAADYALVIEGLAASKMPFSDQPLLANHSIISTVRLLMLHTSDPDLAKYYQQQHAPPSTHTYFSSVPSSVGSRRPSPAPMLDADTTSAYVDVNKHKEFSEERRDANGADVGIQHAPRMTDEGVTAAPKTEEQGVQAAVKTYTAETQTTVETRTTSKLGIDAATLATELRLFRRRQRVADPIARTADVLLEDVNYLQAEYPKPALHHPYQAEVFHRLTNMVRGLNDPVLNNLALAVDEERENMSSTISALQREVQELRHGWLSESSKVERLKDAVGSLVTDRDNVLTVLSNSGRLDSEFLSRLVNRKLSAELSLMNLETLVLKDRVAFYKAKGVGGEDSQEVKTPQRETQMQSPRLDETRLDEHYMERIRKLEEENDVLAQKVALHETRDSVVADTRMLHPGDEARILTERVVQLEGDLAREKDLRRQYAVQSEVIKQIGMDEILRQQEHITLQQHAMNSAGLNPPANSSPLRRY